MREREEFYEPWLARFPQFSLGGTITVWDDPARISGWVKARSRQSADFPSMEAFEPFLAELLAAYRVTWIYVPMIIGHNPFDAGTAPPYNRKLATVLGSAKAQARKVREAKETGGAGGEPDRDDGGR